VKPYLYRHHFHWINPLHFTLLAYFAALAGIAEASTFLEISAHQDDNANLAITEQKTDMAWSALVEFSTLHPLDENWQLGVGASLQSSAWQKYIGLNLTEAGAHLTAGRKYGLGPYAPKLDLRVGISRQFSKVSEWSGTWLRSSAILRRRLSPEWQASVSGEYDRLYAGREVYSTTNITGTFRVDYDPTPDWRISAALGRRSGDQLSWCRASWAPFIGTTQWLDGIFGGDWFPYQERSHALVGEISLSRALSADTALSLSWKFYDADTSPDHDYLRHNFGLQIIHAF
jgi:hypothetical protein